jgi:hypothetical protein
MTVLLIAVLYVGCQPQFTTIKLSTPYTKTSCGTTILGLNVLSWVPFDLLLETSNATRI